MKRRLRKAVTAVFAVSMCLAMLGGCASGGGSNGGATGQTEPAAQTQPATQTEPAAQTPPANEPAAEPPIKFSMTYSDNPTLPFKKDWPAVVKANELFNADVTWEVIPTSDYNTKTAAEVETGTAIDVMLYRTPTTGQWAGYALSGALAPISDYVDKGWAPNFERLIKEYDMQSELDAKRLSDGKYYFFPSIYDSQFYDGGLIIREDLLAKFGMSTPKTYDDLYEYLKACKADNPSSYPLTILVGPRVHYRFTMPSFGVSVGENSAVAGAWVLSWDYAKKEYFPGAIDDSYKEYLKFHAKLYAEGLLDPEFFPEGDMWASKMATGAATATYAYYDQIGGVLANSTVPGIKLNLVPPLAGPGGAHTQPKDRLTNGIVFTAAAAKRPDIERLVRTVDEMFYSDAASDLWCIGVEGVTYTMENGKIVFSEAARNSADGIYKYLQVEYGLGSDPIQQVWLNWREMIKYDENYAAINAEVEKMDSAIQPIPPAPIFSEDQAEKATLYVASLKTEFDTWANDFITGAKSIDKDWDAYVKEMTDKGIIDMCNLYNANKR